MGLGRQKSEKAAKARIAVAACLTFQALLLIARQSSGPPPWKEKPEKIRLETGMDCLYQRDLSSFITSIQLFIPGGKSAVPGGKDGLAYLTTRLTIDVPDFSAAQDIMALGTRMGVAVFEDCSVICLDCFSENLDNALKVASEIVQAPLFWG